MVFMGYKNVEDEAETKKALGIEETVKAEFVVIEDGESKAGNEGAKEDQAPPNGSASSPDKSQDETKKEESKEEGNSKEKQPCKCCTVMWVWPLTLKFRLWRKTDPLTITQQWKSIPRILIIYFCCLVCISFFISINIFLYFCLDIYISIYTYIFIM